MRFRPPGNDSAAAAARNFWLAVVEENTSKVYVGPTAGLLSGQLAAASGAGSALFVINLCASMAPAQLTGKTLPGLDSYRLYQVSRVEDGRTRYRLRLGFFTSESDAEVVLATVREKYPTAFAACLCDEDRRYARGYLPDSASLSDTQIQKRPVSLVADASKAPAAAAPQPAKAAPPAPAKVTAAQAPARIPTAALPVKPAPVKITERVPAATASKPAAASPIAATMVPKAAAADLTEIDLSWEPQIAAPHTAQADNQTDNQTGDSQRARSIAVDDTSDIEMSWEPPSLPSKASDKTRSSAASAPVTIAPVFATGPVIRSKPEVKAPAATQPVKTAAPVTVAAKPAPSAAPVELTLAAESAGRSQQPVAQTKPSTEAFHVGKGVEIPAGSLSLSLAAETARPAPVISAKPAAPAPAAPVKKDTAASKPAVKSKPAAPVKEPPKREPVAAASKPAAVPRAAIASTPPVRRPGQPTPPPGLATFAPELDSTQTIRALTNDELNDASQEKWFAIQLAVSEQPVNLDAMPHLDIFEAYCLYHVASAGSGKIVHSLRLGFFREAVSAEAVGGYLKTFFPNPSVLRISAAEQLRFKDAAAPRMVAAAEPKNDAKVVDLSDARQRAAKPVVPTVTMEVAMPRQVQNPVATADRSQTGTHKINATGSFKPNATGSFKASATGSFNPNATGAHQLSSTGAHKLNASGSHKLNSSGPHKVSSTGSHRALKPAAKNGAAASRHSAPLKNGKTSATGKFRAVGRKSLADQLMDEAREVELSESGIRQLPKNDSLLARLVDKLKK